MPASRIVRWLTLAALIVLAIVLYFRDGLRLPRFSGTSAADTAASAPPPPGQPLIDAGRRDSGHAP
ncbi:MAG: hypothetical protein DMD41_04335 [Gemmatimonadetes bacterium]|nr:MAG: hypothetical protein DMD41_04335 [Gemmatimonadota bacterium]